MPLAQRLQPCLRAAVHALRGTVRQVCSSSTLCRKAAYPERVRSASPCPKWLSGASHAKLAMCCNKLDAPMEACCTTSKATLNGEAMT